MAGGNIADLENRLNMLISDRKVFWQAIHGALRRSANSARVAGARAAARRYNLKPMGRIKNAMSVRGRDANIVVRTEGPPLKLMEFKPSIRRGKGVKVAVRRGEKKSLPHSFFVGIGGGNTYHRTSPKRFPIKSEYTVSIPQMVDDPPVVEAMSDRAEEMYAKRLQHELERRLFQ